MKKSLIFSVMLLLLCMAVFSVCDTTFEWSNSNQTGTLTYTALGLSAPVISGALTVTEVGTASNVTASALDNLPAGSTTNAAFFLVTVGTNSYAVPMYLQ